MIKLILIFIGAGCGGVLRYWLGGIVHAASGHASALPVGTIAVNASGCLVMGVLASALDHPQTGREELRVLLLVGLLGGYTTFSSFGRETLSLFHDGRYTAAAWNVLISNALCLLAVWAGWSIGRFLMGAR